MALCVSREGTGPGEVGLGVISVLTGLVPRVRSLLASREDVADQ